MLGRNHRAELGLALALDLEHRETKLRKKTMPRAVENGTENLGVPFPGAVVERAGLVFVILALGIAAAKLGHLLQAFANVRLRELKKL